MSENRLARNLAQRKNAALKCVMPYLTAGYPDLDTTVQLIRRFDAAGCPAIEIGFPFSDSIADGPVIQESFYRALDAGFQVEDLFAAIAKIRPELSAALVAMVSMSIVRRMGLTDFVTRAAETGFDGLIVPDVPVDECEQLAREAAGAGLCNVLMSAPTSSPARRQAIGAQSTGFIYIIAVKGITGERRDVSADLSEKIARLREVTDTPLIVGFGIGTPEQARDVCRHADGVIVGSAIIRRITECVAGGSTAADIAKSVGAYVDDLVAGVAAPE